MNILGAIVDARDDITDVTDIPPLGAVTDPEALDRLLTRTTVPVTVTLEVYECLVEIDGTNTVSATPLPVAE